MDNVLLMQEMERRQVQEEAALRDTAGLRRIAKGLLIAGWIAPIVPFLGFIGLLVAFWVGVGTGTYLLFNGARKAALKFILAGFAGTVAAGLAWIVIYLMLGIGGGVLSGIF